MAEDNAVAEAPKKKGKLKQILLLVVVILLAVGLSVLGTLWFLGADIPGLGDSETPEPTEEVVFQPSSYVVLDKALVTTVQAEGRQRYAQVYLAFEADNPASLAATELHLPLLRSQLVSVLGGSDFKALQTPGGRRKLSDDMLAGVNEVLAREGEPPLKRVLLRNFVLQ